MNQQCLDLQHTIMKHSINKYKKLNETMGIRVHHYIMRQPHQEIQSERTNQRIE